LRAFADPRAAEQHPCESCWVVAQNKPDFGLGCSVFEVLNAAAIAAGTGCALAYYTHDESIPNIPGLWNTYLLEIDVSIAPWSFVRQVLSTECPHRLAAERRSFNLGPNQALRKQWSPERFAHVADILSLAFQQQRPPPVTYTLNFQFWWGHCLLPSVPRLLPLLFDHVYTVKQEVVSLVDLAVAAFFSQLRSQGLRGGGPPGVAQTRSHEGPGGSSSVLVVHVRGWRWKDGWSGTGNATKHLESHAAARALVGTAEFSTTCGCDVYFMAPDEVYFDMFLAELRGLLGGRDCSDRFVTSWSLLAAPEVRAAAQEVALLEAGRDSPQYPARRDWGEGWRFRSLFDLLVVRRLAPAALIGHYLSSFFTLLAYLAVGEDAKVLSYHHAGAPVHACEARGVSQCDPLRVSLESNSCGSLTMDSSSVDSWRFDHQLLWLGESELVGRGADAE